MSVASSFAFRLGLGLAFGSIFAGTRGPKECIAGFAVWFLWIFELLVFPHILTT